MAIVFPASPTAGQKFIASNGITYTWNSTVNAWTTTGISGSGGTGGGTVTGVTASAPLASSGGNAPNISATLATAGQAAAGTSAAVLMTPEFSVPKDASGMTGAALIPGGNDGARPAPVTGMLRYNNQGGTPVTMEYYDGLAWTSFPSGSWQAGLATAVTASGTSVDFTGIPSWVQRITLMFIGVSTNGTSNPMVQIGSGSISNTGYVASSITAQNGLVSVGANYTTGFGILSGLSGNTISGTMTITIAGGTTWVSSHSFGIQTTSGGNPIGPNGGGSVTLLGTLDRIRITTVGGVNTFDAGSFNILYEG